LVAIEKAREEGATIFGICNVVGSSIARFADEGTYTHAGVEMGVASTKAFTAQLTVIYLIALLIAQEKKRDPEKTKAVTEALHKVPQQVQAILDTAPQIEKIAEKISSVQNMLYLGRNKQFPVALEGALKIKEVSYIHAEAYPAGEMKHGPIALIDENMPTLVIATKDPVYHKLVSNIEELKARKGPVIALVTKGDEQASSLADHVIEVPDAHEMVMPILTTIPLQLLAYYVGVKKGCNVDQPRNLAKSVTVE
jgi:glucosamine--fructose-6-phosphate aminotransferase (isomerizing)